MARSDRVLDATSIPRIPAAFSQIVLPEIRTASAQWGFPILLAQEFPLIIDSVQVVFPAISSIGGGVTFYFRKQSKDLLFTAAGNVEVCSSVTVQTSFAGTARNILLVQDPKNKKPEENVVDVGEKFGLLVTTGGSAPNITAGTMIQVRYRNQILVG